jgi:hypothetical protein
MEVQGLADGRFGPVRECFAEILAAQAGSAAWRAAEIPAVNGHGTAAAVAGFYHALAAGGLLSPGMLAEAVTPQCAGPDRVFGHDNAWGLGFAVDDDGYGMGGLGGNYAGTPASESRLTMQNGGNRHGYGTRARP